MSNVSKFHTRAAATAAVTGVAALLFAAGAGSVYGTESAKTASYVASTFSSYSSYSSSAAAPDYSVAYLLGGVAGTLGLACVLAVVAMVAANLVAAYQRDARDGGGE